MSETVDGQDVRRCENCDREITPDETTPVRYWTKDWREICYDCSGLADG